MTTFCKCLREQLFLHPSMGPQDVVKMCYQAACGAEHLLGDVDGAWRYFESEYAAVEPCDGVLCERISEGVCRVNLAVWKQKGIPKEWLFRMFTATVFSVDGKQMLKQYLDAAGEVLYQIGFDMTAWETFLAAYEADGMPAVRHSERYRLAEQPAYRIVSAEYLSYLSDLEGTSALYEGAYRELSL